MAKSEVRTYFNSRPSARGDWRCWEKEPTREEFQFTPLREGRPAPERAEIISPAISIHAPPRGATAGYYGNGAWVLDFNSRPSARGDRAKLEKIIKLLISIHAPPRGATGYGLLYSWQEIFQFTPLREGRHNLSKTARLCIKFQFTPLREGRRVYLNSMFMHQTISIHAPPRGATFASGLAILCTIFQFTPLREGRQKQELVE